MELPERLVNEFVSITNDRTVIDDKNTLLYGTVTVNNEGTFVIIDGSEERTPVATTVNLSNGDRVTVTIKNHEAVVYGNITSKGATSRDLASKNSTYYSNTAPSGSNFTNGDVWFNTSEDNAIYTWNGSGWVKFALGEDAIADLSISNAKIAVGTILDAFIQNLDAGKITSGIINSARINSSSITAAAISGKEITGGTLRTNTGSSRNFKIDYNGVTEDTTREKEQVYTSVRPANIGNLILNQDGSSTYRSQLIPCRFDPVSGYLYPEEFSGANKYGWYADHFMYAPRMYTNYGKVATIEDLNDLLVTISESAEPYTVTLPNNLKNGIRAITSDFQMAMLYFHNFSFAANTGTSSNTYKLPTELKPETTLDLVSTHNGVRFYITTDGYIRPATAVGSSAVAIRGTFTYIRQFIAAG